MGEEFAEEDKKVKERIDARNGLESYLYNLKNTLDDDEKADSISAEDKKELQDIVDETLDWMEENPEAEKEDYDGKQKEVEKVEETRMVVTSVTMSCNFGSESIVLEAECRIRSCHPLMRVFDELYIVWVHPSSLNILLSAHRG